VKNKRITSAIAALALVIVGSFAVPAMATDKDTGGQCVPSDARTETIEHPAVTHTETKTVIDVGAWDEVIIDTPAGWQRYSWNGDWDSDSAPPFPDARWQANTASDPHGVGVEGAYFRSRGNSGGGDWFYLDRVEAVIETIEHPEITHEETVTITDEEARTDPIAHPAIVCPPDDEDVIVPEVVVEEDVIVPEVVVVVAPAAVVVAPAAVAIAADPRFAG